MKATSGKYLAYMANFEGSAVFWADTVKELQNLWFPIGGISHIFESQGTTLDDLKRVFQDPPAQGVVLDYLKETLPLVGYQNGG